MIKLVAILLLLFPSICISAELGNPNREVEDAIVFLNEHKNYDGIENIRFFSTYAIPETNRESAVLSLSFVIHSLAGIDKDGNNNLTHRPLAIKKDLKFIPIQNVSNSTTLWWIDLRDYNWTIEAWERAVKFDGYFVEPVVRFDRSGLLRLLGGNAVVRADWFITHATDSTAQNSPIYNTLLYAKFNEPKTIDEFRRAWQLDFNRAKLVGNEVAAITTKSNAVARHNRTLFGYNTELGWLYESYDVLDQVGLNDYIEAFFINKGGRPQKSDAGEAFATNLFGMQVYALRDGKGKLITSADAGVARHISDINGDVRVRVGTSCMDCHSAGPIKSENTISELLDSGIKLNVTGFENQQRISRLYKGDEFNSKIDRDKEQFAKSLLKVNGLSPEENKEAYLDILRWYYSPVSLEQAAIEHGLTVKQLEDGLITNKVDRLPGRLMLLVYNKEGIPRDIWETNGKDGIPGMFQQTFITLNGLTSVNNKIIEFQAQKEQDLPKLSLPSPISIHVLTDTFVMNGAEVVEAVDRGQNLVGNGKVREASGVLWNGVLRDTGTTVWIRADHSAKVQKNVLLEHKALETVRKSNIIKNNNVIFTSSIGQNLISTGIVSVQPFNGMMMKFTGVFMEDNSVGWINIDNVLAVRR